MTEMTIYLFLQQLARVRVCRDRSTAKIRLRVFLDLASWTDGVVQEDVAEVWR